jgi:hypothetical protein
MATPKRKPAGKHPAKHPTRTKAKKTASVARIQKASKKRQIKRAAAPKRKGVLSHTLSGGVGRATKLDSVKWALAEGVHEGRPLFIRFRQFLSSFPRSAYPQRINIIWIMREPASTGLPTGQEHARLVTFEDRLVAAVEHDAHSVLSVALTCDGKREWVYHTADVPGFMGRLTDMPQEEDRYPIELTRSEDPDWGYDDAVVPQTASTAG